MFRIEIKDSLAKIYFCKTENRNALSIEALDALINIIKELNNDLGIKTISIFSELNNVFVSGADIREFSKFRYKEGKDYGKKGHLLMNTIENSNKPIIAAINGYAVGGGFELALACHIKFATENAKFGFPEVKLGILPGFGGSQRIFDYVGKSIATDLILTGKIIDVDVASKYSLINYLVDSNNLEIEIEKYALELASNSSTGIKFAIKSINNRFNKVRTNALNHEIEYLAECMNNKDFIEGTSAFLQKRKQNFND
ncbi:MAG: enoyl-CoA hydratase/isomerase family protein [Bacteroidetes bacterium]|nr:enoyl-CoA hydratase/isomerase family protein [Bacteroidota bacterium]